MTDPVRVRVAASPRLFADVLTRSLAGDGVEVSTSAGARLSVVTPDHAADVRSEVVIVLGDSVTGDVQIVIDGVPTEHRSVDATQLRQIVLDLARPRTHDAAPPSITVASTGSPGPDQL